MRDHKYLWIIKFNSQAPGEADLYIPAPPSFGDTWMKAVSPEAVDSEALAHLLRLEEICQKIQRDRGNLEAAAEAGEYLKEAQNVNAKLHDLEKLFKKFNEFLKRLSRPPHGEWED